MPRSSARTGFQLAAPVAAVVLLSSCASHVARRSALSPLTATSSVVSQSQITATRGVTAYDAIHRLRPTALNLGGLQTRDPTVYLDGMKLGGAAELFWISAASLAQIRFLSPVEAEAFYGPVQRGGGAIVLTSRLSH